MGAYPKHVVAVNYHAVDFIVERIVAYVCGLFVVIGAITGGLVEKRQSVQVGAEPYFSVFGFYY